MRAIKTTTISILALGLLAGSVVGVAAQDEQATAEVTSFTGTGTEGLQVLDEGTFGVNADGLNDSVGVVYVARFDSDDDRLTGDATITANWQFPADPGYLLAARTYELANEEGSWVGQSHSLSADDLGVAVEMAVLEGQDGYEGLTAYVHFDWNDDFSTSFSGVIYPGPGPAVPEAYAAE